MRGIQVTDGLKVDAEYSTGLLRAKLYGYAKGYKIIAALPEKLRFKEARVFADGIPVCYERVDNQRENRRYLSFVLPEDAWEIVIR